MYHTLIELAENYKLSETETTKFCQFAVNKYGSVLAENPNISATGFDTLMVDSSLSSEILYNFHVATSGYSVPSTKANAQLRDDAIEAVATYLASQNFSGAFDFNLDMRLEAPEEQISPEIFLSNDLDCTKDQLSDLDEDIHARMGIIQREIANRNRH